MKRILITGLWTFLITATFAQENGIHFEHWLSFKQVLAKAKAEHKFVMMDCFTTWCAPCKLMDKKTFADSAVGTFYNKHFVNIKMQMDTSKHDNQEVKNHYADAKMVAKKYKVEGYPTILFLDPQGEQMDIITGMRNPVEFLESGGDIVDPQNGLHSRIQAFKKNPDDTALLNKLANRLQDLDPEVQTLVIEKLISKGGDDITKEKATLILENTRSSSEKGFEYLRKYAGKIDQYKGEGTAAEKINFIIFMEEVRPVLNQNDGKWDKLDWATIHKKIAAKYPNEVDGAIVYAKTMAIDFANDSQNKKEQLMEQFIKEYKDKVPPVVFANSLDNFANQMLYNKNPAKAVEWSKIAASCKEGTNEKRSQFKTTYAISLYESAKRPEAIFVIKEAIKLSEGGENELASEFQKKLLKKMEKGEKDLYR